jgi:hypothetical protein
VRAIQLHNEYAIDLTRRTPMDVPRGRGPRLFQVRVDHHDVESAGLDVSQRRRTNLVLDRTRLRAFLPPRSAVVNFNHLGSFVQTRDKNVRSRAAALRSRLLGTPTKSRQTFVRDVRLLPRTESTLQRRTFAVRLLSYRRGVVKTLKLIQAGPVVLLHI